ncbi:hypothetical protein EX30DRAFT_86118 [Ascodesmis nigricans]|uniref:Uncharacterized protein n=1 Tax=Ascodesmis nigricans TaxID=341454 RepID=A0A4S2N2Y6_9PEZI|nr:hypothetical protein EX30DRAFT_86118 [Ascodesmis nigricans]
MILSTMPAAFSSFSPSLPSLPAYPASSNRPAKRCQRAYTLRSDYDLHYAYSAYPPSPICSDDEPMEDDAMMESVYSDVEYRSSLMVPASTTSRKRSYGDTGLGVEAERRGEMSAPGGKRRILDLVGGAVRGVWSILTKPLPSFISYHTPATPSKPQVTIAPETPSFHPDSLWSTPAPRSTPFQPLNLTLTPNSFQTPPLSPPATPPVSVEMTVSSGHALSPEQRAIDSGLRQLQDRKRQIDAEMAKLDTTISQRWVMVPPPPRVLPHKRSHTWSSGTTNTNTTSTWNTAASTCGTPRSSRHRPITSCGKKRVFRSPRCGGLGSPTGRRTASGSLMSSAGSMGMGRRAEEDWEMDDDMRRLNDNVKKLIKEGREALGAKVEVLYDEDEFGFERWGEEWGLGSRYADGGDWRM